MSAKDKLTPWTKDEIMAHVALTGRVYAIPEYTPLETLLELVAEGNLRLVDKTRGWERFEAVEESKHEH